MSIDFGKLQNAGEHASSLDFSKAVEIQSGQRIDFSKDNPGVDKLRVELHWDSEHDADASIMILGENQKALVGLKDANDKNSTKGMVWYNNLTNPGIEPSGDARTSDGDPSSPEEVISVTFSGLYPDANAVVIVASTFPEDDKGEGKAVPFGLIHNCRVDIIDDSSNRVLYSYALDEDYSTHTSVELAKFYQRNGEWKLTSMGEGVGTSKQALSDIAKKYGLV